MSKHPRSQVERALRKGWLRWAMLRYLARHGEAHSGEIAEALGTTPGRIRRAAYGFLPEYRPLHAPVPLGWLKPVIRSSGEAFRITSAGRRVVARRGRARSKWARRP